MHLEKKKIQELKIQMNKYNLYIPCQFFNITTLCTYGNEGVYIESRGVLHSTLSLESGHMTSLHGLQQLPVTAPHSCISVS